MLSVDINNSKSFNITAAYRPPSCTVGFFEALEAICIIDMESKEQIILGDLNYLSDRNNMHLSQLMRLRLTYQFQQLINEPTRITPNSSTLIDIILSNEPSRILKSRVVHMGLSDHSMVYAIRKIAMSSKNTHKHLTTRSFKNVFREDLKSAPWESLRNCTTPDEMIVIWENMFLKMADAHVPIRTWRVRNKKSPWITTEQRELITGRNRLKRHAILTKQPSFWVKYRKERNRINNEIKMANANYYKSEVELNVGNPKEIWRTINELTYRKCTSKSSISELKSGDNSLTKPAEICDVLNDHFTSVGPTLASTLSSGNASFDSCIKPVSTIFNLQHTSATEVLNLLGKLSPNKATGLDNISCRLLNEAGPIIATSLAFIINKTRYWPLSFTVENG